MSRMLKIAVAAVALSLSVAPVTMAFASAGDKAACESSQFTEHGVWDCR